MAASIAGLPMWRTGTQRVGAPLYRVCTQYCWVPWYSDLYSLSAGQRFKTPSWITSTAGRVASGINTNCGALTASPHFVG
jgi:hypothetical protein